jgi:serine/threonine protein kinase
VAIKLLGRGIESEAAVRAFRAERHVLTRLEHPNIVRLLDSGTTEDGRPYLITDHAQGIPVTRYCREAPIGETGKLGIFLSICEAIQHAHECKVLLRSLKPANILVSPEGKAKLVDFSAAVWMDPDVAPDTVPGSTSLETLSPEYASPELLRGEPATVRSDVYSLGAILFEMLTGRKASSQHKESGPLGAVAGKAIHADPALRYASMNEFAAAVRHYMKKGGRPAPVSWKLVAAVTVLAGMAFAALLWSRRAPPDTLDSVAVLPFREPGHRVQRGRHLRRAHRRHHHGTGSQQNSESAEPHHGVAIQRPGGGRSPSGPFARSTRGAGGQRTAVRRECPHRSAIDRRERRIPSVGWNLRSKGRPCARTTARSGWPAG